MRKIISAVAMLGIFVTLSGNAQAMDAKEAAAFEKDMDHVMVDILCSTAVIHDMSGIASVYLPKIQHEQDATARTALKHEFGKKLHQAWLDQKYDMSAHEKIVNFLAWLNTQPLKLQSEFAKSWAVAAQQQCPAKAPDARLTHGVAFTLVSSVVY